MIPLALAFLLGGLFGAWIAFAVEGREHEETVDAWRESNERYDEMFAALNESWAELAKEQTDRWVDTWKAFAIAMFFAEVRDWEKGR